MESNETINRKKTVLITFRSSSGYNKEKKLCSLPQDIQTHAIYSSLKFSFLYFFFVFFFEIRYLAFEHQQGSHS